MPLVICNNFWDHIDLLILAVRPLVDFDLNPNCLLSKILINLFIGTHPFFQYQQGGINISF